MSKQPEALRLADALMEDNKTSDCVKSAAELRRLHEAHEWQYKVAGDRLRRIKKLKRVNAELLEALKDLLFGSRIGKYNRDDDGLNSFFRDYAARQKAALAAVKKAEGRT